MARQMLSCLFLSAVVLVVYSQTIQKQSCTGSEKNSADIEPNSVAQLGGILSFSLPGTDGYGCGKPFGAMQMQALESIRWVLSLLNKKEEFLQTDYLTDTYVPGITLGMKVINNCNSQSGAVASIGEIYPGLHGDSSDCSNPMDKLNFGIIGGSSSDEAMDLSQALKPLDIPIISYHATAPQLTTNDMYSNFMRTVAPDSYYIKVIVRVMMDLDWKFITVVYDSGTYGRSAYEELLAAMVEAGLCLTAGVPVDGKDISDGNIDGALNRVIGADATGVVFFGPIHLATALMRRAGGRLSETGELQWIVLNYPVSGNMDIPYMRGLISVTSSYRYMVEFEDHWIRIDETKPLPENPWFQAWFEENKNCSYTPTAGQNDCTKLWAGLSEDEKEQRRREEFQQDQFVEPAVMAVFTYARALRNAQMDKCGAFSGACPALVNMDRKDFYENYLKKVDFTFTSEERVPSLASTNVEPYNGFHHLSFTEHGDIKNPSFYVWNYNDIESGVSTGAFKFKRVGTYINEYLSMNTREVAMYDKARQMRLNPSPKSLCPSTPCKPCLGLPSDLKYFYEHGDIILSGVFSLHDKGSSPMSCGQLKPNQVMYIEAMIYALKSINDDSSILRNIKLGGFGIDDCMSKLIGPAFISQVKRGSLQIKDERGNILEPRHMEAYTAAYTSALTDPLADMTNHLHQPMVGYRAGSSKLDDSDNYPYFIRSAPFLRDEMRAIILLLKYYNWMHVQVFTCTGHHDIDAYNLFRDMAAKEGICVVATHYMAEVTYGVKALGMRPDVPVVVTIMGTNNHKLLLSTLKAAPEVRAHITLIAMSTWGTSTEVVKGMESTAEGVITLSLKHSSLTSFLRYLEALKVADHTSDPWFREWFSQAFDCGPASAGKQACDFSKPINEGPMFHVLYEVESVINGIKALARALDETMSFFCGIGYTHVCSSFTNAANKGSTFMTYLLRVSFPIEDMSAPNTFRFIGSSAAIPFQVYSYRNGAYKEEGKITTWDDMVTGMNSVVLYNGALPANIHPKCPQPCLECLYMFNHQEFIYIPGDVMLGAIFDIHYPGSQLFSCGDFHTLDGAIYSEVVNYALDLINQGKASGQLNNVKIGLLGFDGCSNPTRAQAIINRVNSGFMPFSNNNIMTSVAPDILSWITFDSDVTKAAAKSLQQQGVPVVSPEASLPELADQTKFPTLFRTVYSEAVIAKGMADFVNRMGWKYVFLVNAPDSANREASRLFREYVKDCGICVFAQYEFVTDGSMDVILSSLVKGESQVVAVFSERDQYIDDFLKAKKDGGSGFQKKLVFVANRPWRNAFSYGVDLSNSVFFQHASSTDEFVEYFKEQRVSNSANPWLDDMIEALLDCDMPGTFSNHPACSVTDLTMKKGLEDNLDAFVLTTIDAVYALAHSIHVSLKEKCGNSYDGVCNKFVEDTDTHARLVHHLDEELFTAIDSWRFEFIERQSNRGLTLHRFDTGLTPRVGSLTAIGGLTLTNEAQLKARYSGILSQCSGGCLACQEDGGNIRDFTLIPGDMYIVGLFDVHKEGSDPFHCGEINTKHGAQLLEAFHFALNYVNSNQGPFTDLGIQIGGIGLDVCQSPTRAGNLVANIHSGKVKLVKDGLTVQPRQIDAYIGPMDTKSSIRVADILNQLQIPQISYGATGMELLDREKYRYFLRSVPADDKMGRAIISYLKKFGYNNIQVVKSFDEIGEPGAKEFERLAEVNLVCITKKFLVGETDDIKEEARNVVQQIMSSNNSQVVVLWMKNPLPVLEAVNKVQALYSNTLFVATDKWGADPDYLSVSTIQDLLMAKNLILLDVETADVPGFDAYLADKTPGNYGLSPWFKEFFEVTQGCNWEAGTCNQYETIPRLDKYVQDPYVLYVVNAVFSSAMGIRGAIRDLCKTVLSGYCNSYDNSGERKQYILKYMKAVNFTDDTHQPFFYTADGQSDRGFHFYNVTDAGNNNTLPPYKFEYENVGSYNDSHYMKLDVLYKNSYQAHCDVWGSDQLSEQCTCPFKPDLPSRLMKKTEGGRGLTLVYIGDIHSAHPGNSYACGEINTGVDLHRMLAFFYAIERINTNQKRILPDSIRLDGVALDTCTTGLRLGQDVYNLLSGNQLCDSDDLGKVVSPNSIVSFIVDKDHNALPISTMLSPQGITSISPTATHAMLDNKLVHPTFLRTQGSVQDNSQIIWAVADRLNWNNMGVIFSDTPEHRSAKDAFLTHAKYRNRRTCVSSMATMPANATETLAIAALDTITQQSDVTGVALFVTPEDFRLLMKSSKLLGSTGIVWVVSSNWANAEMDIVEYRSELTGSIWIQTQSAILHDFNEYIKKITHDNPMGIPDDWFHEIYETMHGCKMLDLQARGSQPYTSICTGNEVITDKMLAQDPSVLHVIIAVYASAFGLDNIPQCVGNTLDLSACLQLLDKQKNQLIYDGISRVHFDVLPELLRDESFRFSFDREGNGAAGYAITTRNDRGEAIHLGQYNEQGLDINTTKLVETTSFNEDGLPVSRCAIGATCKCSTPNGATYVLRSIEDFKQDLSQAVVGQYVSMDGEFIQIESIPKVDDRFDAIWAIILISLAAAGALIGLVLFVYLLVMYPVRGGTSILGYIVSFSIVLLYLMVIPFIYHASERICGIRRFNLGLVYSMAYSALLVKLLDCCRVRGKNDAYNVKYSKLGRPMGLFFVTFFLVLVQCMINAEWLILEEPHMELVLYEKQVWPRCTPDDFYDQGLVLSLVYVMGLIVVSFVLGIWTFFLNVNHKEARWIFGIIILSIPCWVIWCLVATMGEYKVRDAAVAVGLLINATFMLLLMPVRKLYLLNKYNKMIEEEDKQNMYVDGNNSEYGGSVYERQYANHPRMHSAVSTHGSSIGYGASQSHPGSRQY